MKTILAWLTLLFTSTSPTPMPIVPTPTPVPTTWTVNYGAETYMVEAYKVPSAAKVSLINNLQTKTNTKQLIEENKCMAGINGGFYDTSDRALGLMVIDGQEIYKFRSNALFNGFVIDGLSIVEDIPIRPKYAIQTGPTIIKGGKIQDLRLVRDSYSRRMVVANGQNAERWLMTVFGPTDFEGPELDDLGEIVTRTGEKYGLEIDRAINMDGGTASALYSPNKHVEEFSRIGSWWCIYE